MISVHLKTRGLPRRVAPTVEKYFVSLFFIGCGRQGGERSEATSPLEMVPTEAKANITLSRFRHPKALVFSGRTRGCAPTGEWGAYFGRTKESAPTEEKDPPPYINSKITAKEKLL